MKPEEQNPEDFKWQGKLELQIRQKEKESPREFGRIYEAFAIPLQRTGIRVIVLALVLSHLAMFMPLAGIFLGMIIRFLFCSYVMHVIAHAAKGREGLPEWSMENLETELHLSMIFFGLVGIAWIPAIAWAKIASPLLGWPGKAVYYLLAVAGTFCLPMMLLIGSVSHSLIRALNLRAVISAIGLVFRPYLMVFAICALSLAGLVWVSFFISGAWEASRIGSLLGDLGISALITALGVYCLMVVGLILGRFYYCCLESEIGA